MATPDEVVDLAADPDTATDHDNTDQASQGNSKGKIKSAMYENWNFEQAGKRDKTHLGAQCWNSMAEWQITSATAHR